MAAGQVTCAGTAEWTSEAQELMNGEKMGTER